MENKNYENERFEFLLYINDHILVQRFFNVPYYNEGVVESMDLKWLYDDCTELIKETMMQRTIDDLWNRFNPYIEQKVEDIPREGIYDKPTTFTFEIKVDKETLIKGNFDGSIYSPGARYQIDIKDLIPKIIKKIRKTFKQKKFTYFYGDVEL